VTTNFLTSLFLPLYSVFQILLCSLLHCTVLADNIDIESEGLIPVYSIDNHKYEEGSGDIEDDKFVVTKCECSKPSTEVYSGRNKLVKYSIQWREQTS
jgi:hypothetical protein